MGRLHYILTAIVGLVFDAIESLLLLRFIFVFFGAGADNRIIKGIYGVSRPFVEPFQSIFAPTIVSGFMIEWSTVIAMVIYALLGALIVNLIQSVAISDYSEEEREVRLSRHRHV